VTTAGSAPTDTAVQRRLWTREIPFAFGAVVLASLLIWGIGRLGWAEPHPLWLVAIVVAGAAAVSFLTDPWRVGCPAWQYHTRFAMKSAAIAVCIYLTGWGPTLAIGLFYVIADTLNTFGADYGLTAISWVTVTIAVGTWLVAFTLVPSEVPTPEVYGISVLAAAGLVALGLYMRTLTVRREMVQKSLREEQDRFVALVQHSSDVIVVVDKDGTVTYASPSSRVIAVDEEGHSLAVGRSAIGALHPDDMAASTRIFTRMLHQVGDTESGEMRARHIDGRWHWMEFVATNLVGVPGVDGVVVNGRDVSDRKAAELDLVNRATHDPLTGLANRAHLLDRLERAIGRLNRYPDSVAVLYLDLDRFKDVNDAYGHVAGDYLLVTLVGRLHDCVRPQDTLARIGGDEFCIVLETAGDSRRELIVERAASVSERVIAVCQEPVTLPDGTVVSVSASIGVVVCEPDQSTEEVLHLADLAMYQAKANGRGRYEMI
jgi:diguanylate cyclase (GGDEF)-like protein/PAS domain S-box-containing protein